MLNLTRPNFEKIKAVLLRQQKKVEEDLKAIERADPVLGDSLAESSEPGTDSWLADVHNQAVAVQHNLQDMLRTIKKSLTNLRVGKYGICEKCGKPIEIARLEAMPTATLCLADSKKTAKK